MGKSCLHLTARTITRSGREAFDILGRERNMCASTVTVTAKLCVLEKPSCNPYDCPRAKGHFDRVNDAVYEIIHEGDYQRKVLQYMRNMVFKGMSMSYITRISTAAGPKWIITVPQLCV